MDISAEADESMEMGTLYSNSTQCDFTHYCAKWILKTSETRRLTRNSTLGIVQDVTDLVREVSTSIEDQVKVCLQQNGINFDTVLGLSDVFSENNPITMPFSELMTFHHTSRNILD